MSHIGWEFDGLSGQIKWFGVPISHFGRLLIVDSIHGDDTYAIPYKTPFQTIEAAISASTSGDSIWLMPGQHYCSNGVVLPSGVSIRGFNLSNTSIQVLNATSDTTLLTMGINTRVEDVTLKLTSQLHVNLTGILFPSGTAGTSKVRTLVLDVDNQNAGTAGTSNCYGIKVDDSGASAPENNALRACTIRVTSTGQGKKASIYSTGSSVFSGRDVNLVTRKVTGGTGEYFGIETNNASSEITLSVSQIDSPDGADISQTQGAITLISCHLRNSTANGKSFKAIPSLPIFTYCCDGKMPKGTKYWKPGTSIPSSVPSHAHVHQKSLIKGMHIAVTIPPGVGNSDTWIVQRNNVDTALTITLSDLETSKSRTDVSVTLEEGDLLSLKSTTGAATNTEDPLITFDMY